MADFLLDSLYLRRRGCSSSDGVPEREQGLSRALETGRREMPHREERKQEKAFLT